MLMKMSVKIRSFVCMLLAVCVLSGCDWVKKQLGMATSEDIERIRMELQMKELREKQIKDSIEAARLDSLRLEQEKNVIPYGNLDKKFYVIMGSFKVISNAEVLKANLEKAGYSPVRIALQNGFDMVALAGFNSYSEALAEMDKIGDNDLCPYDVWIYSISQNLHKQ